MTVPVQHVIDTGEAKPVSRPMFSSTPMIKAVIAKKVKAMLQANIISPTSSPFSANVVLVVKKGDVENGRMAIDYRQLNAITQPDKYPPPSHE